MTILKSFFARFTSKHSEAPLTAENVSLSAWRHDVDETPPRQVERVQFCSAKTSGTNETGESLQNHDTHTFLRAFVAPSEKKAEEVVLIERIEASQGSYHSVVPIQDTPPVSDSGTSHSAPLDRASIFPQGSSAEIVPKLEVERTLEFNLNMSVQELATILDFVSGTTKSVYAEFGCADLTRSFAFTCLAALSPALPPSSKKLSGHSHFQGISAVSHEAMLEGDATRFIDQYSSMARDTQSAPTHQLIRTKRGGQMRLLSSSAAGSGA